MTTPPTINWANRISSDVFIRDCDDPTAQMKAVVYSVNYDTKEADVGFYPERGVKFSMIHLPDIYRATIPLSDLSLTPLSGAAEFGYADIIRRGDKTSDLSYLDWTGVTHAPVTKDEDADEPDETPRFQPSPDEPDEIELRDVAAHPDQLPRSAGVQRAGGTGPLFTRAEVLAKIAAIEADLANVKAMAESME